MNTLFSMLSMLSMLSLSSATSPATSAPSCFQVGQKLFGKNIPEPCVHHTDDYTVSFDVSASGSVEIVLPSPDHWPDLEVYTGARVVTPWEDCCPPPTFAYQLECEKVQEEGSCCYSADTVYVSGLPEQSGCVHSVEDWASHIPSSGSVSWATGNPEANHEVEVYASLHPTGCCECFMYSIPCSPCV